MPSRLFLVPAIMIVASALAAQQAPIVEPGAPGQPSKTLPPNTKPAPIPINPADVDFMQGMIMHHGQAVTMTALIDSHTANPEVREIGKKITASQTSEIELMKHWLEARNKPTDMSMPGMPDMDMHGDPMPLMPGMLTPAQMTALSHATGPQFDYLFLTGMIQHHTGALTMVHQLFAQPGAGQDADLFNFATDVDNTQRAEIRIMQSILAHDAAKDPAAAKDSKENK
jgi:uncharacterized protein (DUF305 family)